MEKFITKKEKFSYGFAAAASYMAAGVTQSYLMFFFTDIALLAPAFVTALMVAARIWDALNDPLMGLIIEKTDNRHGKMRPHIFIGSFLILIFSILLFIPIAPLKNSVKMAYAAIVYICYGMAYTYVDVPAMSLMSVSTPNSDERASLLSFYVMVGTMGGLVPLALLPVLQPYIPPQWLYLTLAIVSGLFAFSGYVMLSVNCRERFTTKTQKYKIKQIVKTALKNKPMLLTFLMSMIASPRYMMMPVLMYIATYVIHIGSLESGTVLLILYLVLGSGMFAGIFSTPWLYNKFGYKKASIISALIGGVFLSLAFIIYKFNIFASLPFLTIGALATGAYNVLPYPMVGDSLDYLEWKTGERMEGLCFSLNSFVTKFNNAVGFIGLAVSLIIFGFIEPEIVGEPLPQAQRTLDGFYSLVSLTPGISFLVSIVPMLFYDIDKNKQQAIRADLSARHTTREAAELELPEVCAKQ